ncbi:yth domain-containing protein, putative [Ricinus communis]|uniref:YTH domain-containing family protein n=1 Tax=Ricinus communis TaxID=3988 RepID=B9SHG5_RICCO|nr:yth domain-containing protein, putative [Ricinus communis]
MEGGSVFVCPLPITVADIAGVLENLSLDSQTKTAEISEHAKLSTSQYGSSDLATNSAKPLNQSTNSLHIDQNAYYSPNGYLSTAYYYGGHGGPSNGWIDYSSYVNLDEDIYGNSDTLMYHQGYGYMPYGTYPSPNSNMPAMGNDGQLYGTQQYQYPNPFYQAPNSTGTFHSLNSAIASQTEVPASPPADKAALSVGTAGGNPNNAVNSGCVNRSNGPKPFRPSNQNSSSNFSGAYKSGGLQTGFPSSGYHDPRFGYDAFQSPMPWLDAPMYSNAPAGHAMNTGLSSPLNLHPTRPISGLGQGSGAMNLMYPDNRMYGQYGYRAGAGFGSFGANSWTNGRGWVVVDNKYKPKARGYGNENIDGLSELNRGPRAKGFRNHTEFGPVSQAVQGQNLPLSDNTKEDNSSQVPDNEQYNREDFPEDYSNAKFFVIKSYSEDDVHKSIKYGVWASTANGNKKLDAAYHEAKETSGGCPIFLLFSVNTSGQFVGLAEMVGPVDFNKTVEYWQQEKWIGCFPVKWHIIKDVPNNSLRHVTLENNENKPVTNSRDTQEVIFEKGIQMLKIFKGHRCKTSILDDFEFYAARERIMQEKRAKQKIQKQVLDGKPIDDQNNNKEKVAMVSQKSTDSMLKEPVVAAAVESGKISGEVRVVEANGSGASVENSPNDAKSVVSSESKVASAC